MRRIALGLVLGSVVGLVSCGDSKPKNNDGGVDAGVAMCKATFAFVNRIQLGAQTKSAGKCSAPADLDAICANDVGGSVRAFGAACFQADPTGGESVLAACVLGELKKDTVADPSDGCLTCYLATTGCTLANCRTECAQDPTATPCLTCQVVKGCLPTFFQCSGLPVPPGITFPDGGATGDGGAGDADAAAGDTATEASSDTSDDDAAATDADPDAGTADTGVDTATD